MKTSPKRKNILGMLLCCLFLFAGTVQGESIQAQAAAKLLNLDQIQQTFVEAFKDQKTTVTFTAPGTYTTAQIQTAMEDAAKSLNMLLSGTIQFSKQTNSASGNADYKVVLSEDALMKVKVLKSKQAAVKAAADALKNSRYSTNFYSDTSYYDVFKRILEQHPEYNYSTMLWRSSNGSYGYHRGNGLTKKQQNNKIKAADQAASKAVQKCIKSGMSDKQKARAIHNYLIKNCRYDDSVTPAAGTVYRDAFTAYGVLVKGTAVCQGYAAAFNLMAAKCGLQSMTVCGTAGGVSHAWNCVKLGGKYRYIDCTWDDTDLPDNKPVFEYFNVGAKKMRERHVWNKAEFPSGDTKYSQYFQ